MCLYDKSSFYTIDYIGNQWMFLVSITPLYSRTLQATKDTQTIKFFFLIKKIIFYFLFFYFRHQQHQLSTAERRWPRLPDVLARFRAKLMAQQAAQQQSGQPARHQVLPQVSARLRDEGPVRAHLSRRRHLGRPETRRVPQWVQKIIIIIIFKKLIWTFIIFKNLLKIVCNVAIKGTASHAWIAQRTWWRSCRRADSRRSSRSSNRRLISIGSDTFAAFRRGAPASRQP